MGSGTMCNYTTFLTPRVSMELSTADIAKATGLSAEEIEKERY